MQWSPHDSTRFVVGKDDLRLYEQVRDVPAVHTCRRSFRRVDVIVSAEVPQFRCLEWCPDANQPNLLGVGLGVTGKLLLTQFNSWDERRDLSRGKSLITNSVTKEFSPKIARTCNAISWNPVNTNQIAVGLEKVRSDFSTLVWDVNSEPVSNAHPKSPTSSASGQNGDLPVTQGRRARGGGPRGSGVPPRSHLDRPSSGGNSIGSSAGGTSRGRHSGSVFFSSILWELIY
jgi:hypothetical protein